MSTQKKQRNLNFRERELNLILSRLRAGDSCSVVGVGSVGKSNLLKHLLRDDVRSFHLGADAQGLLLVPVDPNNMLESLPSSLAPDKPGPWAGYEIMLHRLHKALYPFTELQDHEQQAFLLASKEIRNGSNPMLAIIGLRYLELALEQLFRSGEGPSSGRRIVFVFDEFEEMLERLPDTFFKTLRGIRDDYKYQLMYLTFTRRPLMQIAEEEGHDILELEPFAELFTDSTIYLGPYTDEDAMAMLDRLAERQETNLTPSARRFLLRVTGGYAGLLRASFRLSSRVPHGTPDDKRLQFLAESPAIQAECKTIWDSLSEVERVTLRQIIAEEPASMVSNTAIRLLLEKQLLKGQGAVEVYPPLFREFVNHVAGLT